MKKVNALAALSSVAVESTLVDAKRFSTAGVGERVGFIMSGDVEKDGVVMAIPEAQAVTSIDAEKQEVVGTIAGSGVSELVALTLWVLAERAKGAASAYAALLGTLPDRTNTPLLWSDEELGQLLFGSPVLAESMARKATLRSQWQAMHDEWFSKDPATFPASTYGYEPFANAFSVVLAHAIYLPSAGMFALLPVASLFGRTGNSNGSDVDYDEATGRVVVTAGRPYREGQELLLNDERPNGEVFMATGTVPENNNSDYLNFPAELIESDKYFVMKQQILESMGFETKQIFPVYLDRMPNQLYAYVRLSRVMDPALFAKVSFDQDVVLSQMNEYESLQVLMGDCRERLAAYIGTLEEDIKMSQRSELSVREKLAVRLRLTEKRILSKTMDAVRTKLAPVRGIPTKSGTFKDANSDLVEIFDALESIPAAPAALVNSFLSWAKGEQDPDWGKPRPKKDLPKRPW
ncbi:hypothetical protein FOA52_013992 [Chlamydomonas sp. UWO 241]|nr:hypothetical protein FOA52_013992 [Chlamydomonas sp. UWO 241]